ncbi:hypothetical protein FRC12_018821 [Ceratobasidium sp. 428]|nr:hypothetical protein FRC12_018821 [Ceratobasidium sp. 428]
MQRQIPKRPKIFPTFFTGEGEELWSLIEDACAYSPSDRPSSVEIQHRVCDVRKRNRQTSSDQPIIDFGISADTNAHNEHEDDSGSDEQDGYDEYDDYAGFNDYFEHDDHDLSDLVHSFQAEQPTDSGVNAFPLPPQGPQFQRGGQQTDVAMADSPAPTMNGNSLTAQDTNAGAGASLPSASIPTPPHEPGAALDAQLPLSDTMDVDPVEPVTTDAGQGVVRASPPPFADGPSHQPSVSHTPPVSSPLPPDTQPNSSPGVLPALTKRPSHLGVEQLKAGEDTSDPDSSNLRSSNNASPLPRAPRASGDAPEEGEITLEEGEITLEEGEITPAARAAAPSYTPSNGSPATTTVSLPSGPRDRQPPTELRRFSVDPPSSSPSGSRPPPSGPSHDVNGSPQAPPSGPRAKRRYTGSPPPTGPRGEDQGRERGERDGERDQDRDARSRGRAFGVVPRGPSADRPWRGRGRGLPSRGGSYRP